MSTVTLVDFEDLYTAIAEEVKIQLTDGATIGRIKRDINMIYLSHVIPFKPRAWWWLKKYQDVQTYAKITTGTISLVNGSVTVTFSSAPATSVQGYYLKVEGFQEIIEITAHTGGVATATLKSAWQRGTLSGQGYACWLDVAPLDTDVKEVIQVTHDKMTVPLELCSSTKFFEKRARIPDFNGYPQICMVDDFDSNGARQLRWFPSQDTTKHTMHVECVQEATRLSADADEPSDASGRQDRTLFYGGVLQSLEAGTKRK
jgi:hypothetical protein